MKRLSYENGNIVLRDLDGKLHWSRHWVDMKGSYVGENDGGGYIEVLIDGKLIQNSDYHSEGQEYCI